MRLLVRTIARAHVSLTAMIPAQVVLLVEDVRIVHLLVVQVLQAVHVRLVLTTVLLLAKRHVRTHVKMHA